MIRTRRPAVEDGPQVELVATRVADEQSASIQTHLRFGHDRLYMQRFFPYGKRKTKALNALIAAPYPPNPTLSHRALRLGSRRGHQPWQRDKGTPSLRPESAPARRAAPTSRARTSRARTRR